MKAVPCRNAWGAILLAAMLLASSGRAAVTVIDYYRLGEADPGAANGGTVNATTADSAGANPLTRIGSPTYTNGVSADAALHTGSQLAVSFSGSGQSLSNSLVSTVTDNFGIEAWARPNLASSTGVIAYNGNTGSSGWGFFQGGASYSGLLGGVSIFGASPVTAGAWTHLALVRASGTTTLYVNGVAAATETASPNVPTGGFGVGQPGQTGTAQTFNGQIDEVRVFTFAAGQFSVNDLLINASVGGLATMKATLQTDMNGNGRVNPGDTLRYTVVITNNTGVTLSNLVYNSGAVPNAPQVGGSLTATPLARADGPPANSVPGNAFHGTFNTTLNVSAGSGLLANDFLGVPSATISSFGGGSFGGLVTDHAAGTSAIAAGIGTLTVNADGSLSFVPASGFTGYASVLYRLANTAGTSDTSATLAIGVRVSAAGDSYNVTGNTMLDSSLIPQSLYANDAGDGIGISNATTPGHGTVSLSSINGNFIYTPAPAYTGPDSFNYTITNGFGSSTATVNLAVANKVWYTDGSSVAGTADGRSATPFKTVLAFTSVNDGAGGHPADNDLILLRDGSYTDGLVLRVGQKLIGDGSSGTLSAAFGFTLAAGSAEAPGVAVTAFSGIDPVISQPSSNAILLNANNTIRGVTAGNTPNGFGYLGGAVGALNISESSKVGIGGAISITGSGGLGVSFDTLGSTNALGAAINLLNCAGTFSATSGDISTPVGAAIFISGGAGNITYPGSITKNSAGRIVDIQNRTGGSITLSGALTQNNAAGTGINLTTNASTTVNFSGPSKALNTAANPALTMTNNNGTTVTFSNGGLGITTTSAPGLVLVDVNSLTVSGAGNTITSGSGTTFVNTGAGSGTIDVNAALTGSSRLIDIENRTGGSVTLSGNLANNPGTGMLIQNNSGGTITLSGATKTFNTGANTAVTLTSNSGATINFSNGGLAITTTTTGFNATGGAAAINVTGTGNTINSGTGTALNVASTTIGASGLTFQSISSSGASSGIVLTNTGTSGGLSVVGDGASARNGSGGTIQSTTTHGVILADTAKISLTHMNINSTADQGVYGIRVNGFVADWDSFSNDGNSNAGSGEGALFFGDATDDTKYGLVGSSPAGGNPTRISNNNFVSSAATHLRIYNVNGPTLTQLDVTNNTFTGLGTNPPAGMGGGGFQMELRGTAGATVNVTANVFTNNFGPALQGTALRQSQLTFNVGDGTAAGANSFNNQAADDILMSNKDDAHLTTSIRRNTFTVVRGNAIFVGNGTPPVSSLSSITAVIDTNTITTSIASENINHVVLLLFSGTNAPSHVTITNNFITNNGQFDGINLNTPDAGTSPHFEAKVVNNTVNNAASAVNGINLNARQSSTAIFKVEGNTTQAPSSIGIQVRERDSATIQLEKGSSASTDPLTVLTANNPNAHGSSGFNTFVTAQTAGSITVVSNGTGTYP